MLRLELLPRVVECAWAASDAHARADVEDIQDDRVCGHDEAVHHVNLGENCDDNADTDADDLSGGHSRCAFVPQGLEPVDNGLDEEGENE